MKWFGKLRGFFIRNERDYQIILTLLARASAQSIFYGERSGSIYFLEPQATETEVIPFSDDAAHEEKEIACTA